MNDDMKLPEGYHCSDCKFYSYCLRLFDCAPMNIHCDWAPSRFILKIPPQVVAEEPAKESNPYSGAFPFAETTAEMEALENGLAADVERQGRS